MNTQNLNPEQIKRGNNKMKDFGSDKQFDSHEKHELLQNFSPNDAIYHLSTKATSLDFHQDLPISFKSNQNIQLGKLRNQDFKGETEKIFCLKCQSPSKHPYQCSYCQMIFCLNDFQKMNNNSNLYRCPNGCSNIEIKSFNQKKDKQNLKQGSNDNSDSMECVNFGCGAKLSRNEIKQHNEVCTYRVVLCERCKSNYRQIESHDCIASLSHRCQYLESLFSQLKVELQSHKRKSKTEKLQIRRIEQRLQHMDKIYFRPDMPTFRGLILQFEDQINDLPKNTESLIIRFTLSDINIRKMFSSLQLKQKQSNDIIELGNYFTTVDNQVPKIGFSTEIIMPWDMEGPQTIELQVIINQNQTLIVDNDQYVTILLAGYIAL